MSNAETHPTVGRQFKGPDGAVYLCTRYLQRAGFDMRAIAHGKDADEHTRPVGAVCNVSERAIGRSFREVWNVEPVAHEDGCECFVCSPLEE